MTGKKKQKAPSGGWGGKRPGSGRKPAYMLTDNQIKSMLREAKKRSKLEGMSLDVVLLDIAYGIYSGREVKLVTATGISKKVFLDSTIKEALTAIKLYKEMTMAKISEQHVDVTTSEGPRIGLPPAKADPALEVIEGGK